MSVSRSGVERNYLNSWTPNIDSSKINQDQSSSSSTSSPTSSPVSRLNSIAVLLEQFRKEETPQSADTKRIPVLPHPKSSLTSSISSSSLSGSSEISSVTSTKAEWVTGLNSTHKRAY